MSPFRLQQCQTMSIEQLLSYYKPFCPVSVSRTPEILSFTVVWLWWNKLMATTKKDEDDIDSVSISRYSDSSHLTTVYVSSGHANRGQYLLSRATLSLSPSTCRFFRSAAHQFFRPSIFSSRGVFLFTAVVDQPQTIIFFVVTPIKMNLL